MASDWGCAIPSLTVSVPDHGARHMAMTSKVQFSPGASTLPLQVSPGTLMPGEVSVETEIAIAPVLASPTLDTSKVTGCETWIGGGGGGTSSATSIRIGCGIAVDASTSLPPSGQSDTVSGGGCAASTNAPTRRVMSHPDA